MKVMTSFRKLLDYLGTYVAQESHRTFQDEDDDVQYHMYDGQH